MNTITLTPDQVKAVVAKHALEFDRQLAMNVTNYNKIIAATKRRADAKVDRANQRTTDWKLKYEETRRKLLAAQAEIVALKRRLKAGEWDE